MTWGKRGFLQARAAAKAPNRLFQMMRNPGGHSLIVIRMPDDRSDMMLCAACGKKGDLTSHRVFTCGDTATTRTRSLNMRKRDIERVEALLDEAKETSGQETQAAALEATAKALRDTLNIPPRRVLKQVHDMEAILVAKGKQPHATAVCTVCKTMATDREHGRRLNKARCFQGGPGDASEKSRRRYVAKLREAAGVAKEHGQSHIAKGYRRAARMLAIVTSDAPPELSLKRKRGNEVPDGSASATTATGTMTNGSAVPTTPSRRLRHKREKGPPNGGADSEGTALSPLPLA